MPHADVEGRRVYFEDSGGPGLPLTLAHGLLMDHFSRRREVIGFRTSVIYDYASQPLLTLPATE